MQALNLQQDVPTEHDLHVARVRRDEDWRQIRLAWLGGGGDSAAPARDLAEAFERSQALADVLADRLRREADRVTRKTECLSQLDRYRAGARPAFRNATRRRHG